MPQIDINTLFLVLIAISVTVAAMLASVGSRADKSLLIWSTAYLAQAAGFLLISLRQVISDVLSIWLGNLLVSMGYSLLAAGLLNFLHRATSKWVVLVPALLFLNFLYLFDNLEARLVLGGLTNTGQMLFLILLLRRHRFEIAGRGKQILTVCFAVGATLSLIRPLTVIAGVAEIPSYDSGGFAQTYTFLGINILSIANALGLVLMEKEQAEATMYSMARSDYLTGLMNRRSFYERINQLISDKKSKQYAALILLDLDNFKPLNDTHGHGAGDQMLIQAANRMSGCIGEHDVVARLGGDEFVFLLPFLGTDQQQAKASALEVAEKIKNALAEPYALTSGSSTPSENISFQYRCTASLGVQLFSQGQRSREAIMREADMAMYAAKTKEKGTIAFT
ncbi:GGDEF domain-containing protein [Gammaproteobacteria bacterium LSUCC0112]|nr:GGDEF domain-containing protein [Gammaproteobacteria bacterium LSUCC0112]